MALAEEVGMAVTNFESISLVKAEQLVVAFALTSASDVCMGALMNLEESVFSMEVDVTNVC